jgi:hypothetical protein
MPEREHFTNGRCFFFGTGLTLVLAAFGVQVSGWPHWITVGAGYGAGIILMLLAAVLITKSYFSRQSEHGGEIIPEKRSQQPAQNAFNLQIKDTLSIKPVSAELVLTPLQIDAFVLARDLRQLLREVGTNPHPGWKEPTGRLEFVDARAAADICEWNTALAARYKNQLSDRVVSVFRRIAETGFEFSTAEQYAAALLDGVDKAEQVKAIAAALTFMAAQIENKK